MDAKELKLGQRVRIKDLEMGGGYTFRKGR